MNANDMIFSTIPDAPTDMGTKLRERGTLSMASLPVDVDPDPIAFPLEPPALVFFLPLLSSASSASFRFRPKGKGEISKI